MPFPYLMCVEQIVGSQNEGQKFKYTLQGLACTFPYSMGDIFSKSFLGMLYASHW